MTFRTPEEAATVMCPVARVKPWEEVHPCCDGPRCMVWRWEPLSSEEPAFKAAIQARMAEGHAHKQAAPYVFQNREALGLPTEPTHGFCGLGSRPVT